MSRYTRREFVKLVSVAVPTASLFSIAKSLQAAETSAKSREKPNSKVAGVQIGLNVPYSFGVPGMSGDEVLEKCLQLGLSAVELRTQPVEAFLGVPANLISAAPSSGAAAEARSEQ